VILISKKIPLQNGMFAIVDDEDYERVNEYIWYLTYSGGTTKTVVTNIDRSIVLLTRFLSGVLNADEVVSFKNTNRLDFRKQNLLVNDGKYGQRSSRGHRGTTSKYKGVSWNKKKKKWIANVHGNGKQVYLGAYGKENDAARTYNEAARYFFGEGCYQNIIGKDNNCKSTVVKKTRQTRKINSTGYRGVAKYYNKWRSQVWEGKTVLIGTFGTKEQAAKAYDKKAYELYGDKAILNFPESINEYKEQLNN